MAPLLRDEPLVLSVSQITQYLLCGLKYRFRYIDRIPPAFRSVNLAFGASIHSAIAFWHEQRLAGIPVDLPKVLRIFRADWAAQKTEGVQFEDGEDEASLVAKGEVLVRLFTEAFADVEVRTVEQSFEIELTDPETGEVHPDIRLRGYLDLVLAGDVLVELKTAARLPDAETIARSIQLTAYSLAYRLARDRDPTLRFVYLLKTKTPRIETIPTARSAADQAWFVGLAGEVAAGIRARVFPPSPGWACAGCEYRERCEAWRMSAARSYGQRDDAS